MPAASIAPIAPAPVPRSQPVAPRNEPSRPAQGSYFEPARPAGLGGGNVPARRPALAPERGSNLGGGNLGGGINPGNVNPGGADKGGWLSELLARASDGDGPALGGSPRGGPSGGSRGPVGGYDSRQGQPERPVHHTIESLDSLSVDIARMIDHEAAVDLWERYKKGERNVFTRRLYTMQGQQTFEEIRRKYRRDLEFRDTVDRYIGEFERLLEQVSRDERGQALTKTYLTSDTGKVYTLLAHAAGRFD